LRADLGDGRELLATNGDFSLCGSATEELPGSWYVGIFDADGEKLAGESAEKFADAVAGAVESVVR
jgi:hypothetical protein